MSQDYRDLQVWKKAIELTIRIYNLTESFPRSELYGLTSQLQRASVSIASNIAEGRGRLNAAEFRQFLGVAQGSTYELQTQLIVARSLGLANPETITLAESLSNEVAKMLTALFKNLLSELAGKSKQLEARS